MLASDDPRRYRHASNAHPGQKNSPLDTTSNRWLRARIRLARSGIRTIVIPEVFVEFGDRVYDPATGAPRTQEGGRWVELSDQRSQRPLRSVVLTGLPGGRGRLRRATNVWKALFHARALIPQVVDDTEVRSAQP